MRHALLPQAGKPHYEASASHNTRGCSIHTDIFVPFSSLLLHNAMKLPALHQMQQVNQIALVHVSQASTGFDLCHVDTILQEN